MANIVVRRWTFYVLLIWTGILLISLIFLVPETYHPVYVFFSVIKRDGTSSY